MTEKGESRAYRESMFWKEEAASWPESHSPRPAPHIINNRAPSMVQGSQLEGGVEASYPKEMSKTETTSRHLKGDAEGKKKKV